MDNTHYNSDKGEINAQKMVGDYYMKNNLKKIRVKKELTQKYIAEKLDVDRSSISKWEKGEYLPRIETLIALLEILDCTLEDLIKKKM